MLICTSLLSVLPAAASDFESLALAIRLMRAFGKSASSILTARCNDLDGSVWWWPRTELQLC